MKKEYIKPLFKTIAIDGKESLTSGSVGGTGKADIYGTVGSSDDETTSGSTTTTGSPWTDAW